MRRQATLAATVLGAFGVLAIPSSALASYSSNCTYATSQEHSQSQMVGSGTVTVYADTTGNGGMTDGATAAAGLCADGFAQPGFEGGAAEAGAGEDQAGGTADPGAVPGQPDAYVVVDGDDANMDPGDGYAGVSNWETGSRTSQADCEATGPDNPDPMATASSNSGGCLGVKGTGEWVYVPEDVPTPVCGNTSGNGWDGSGNDGPGTRDGCAIP